MKTNIKFLNLLLAAGLAATPCVLSAQEQEQRAAEEQNQQKLQVSVDVPPEWMATANQDFIAEDFGHYVRTVFRRMGYEGEVEYAHPFGEHPESEYTIDLQILRWRVNRVGNVECVFSASVKTPAGEKHLGTFSDTTLTSITGPSNRFQLAESFRDSAEGAIRDLYREVAKSELVPGVRAARA